MGDPGLLGSKVPNVPGFLGLSKSQNVPSFHGNCVELKVKGDGSGLV